VIGVFVKGLTRNGGVDSAMALDGEVLSRMPRLAVEKKVTEAFVALREPVYRYVQTILRSDADAEEITQEAFIRLLRELRRGRPVENVRSWVFRVAHNLAIDEVRRPHFQADCLALDDPALQKLCEPAAGPEENALDQERTNEVRRALALLKPEERQCLDLRAVGLRYREIAEVLETHIPNVQALLVRAIATIAKNIHV
jgi:RNA polymerase sigma-70 factor (ECF subfamily)